MKRIYGCSCWCAVNTESARAQGRSGGGALRKLAQPDAWMRDAMKTLSKENNMSCQKGGCKIGYRSKYLHWTCLQADLSNMAADV